MCKPAGRAGSFSVFLLLLRAFVFRKIVPVSATFRPAASRFQPPVRSKGVDRPNFPSLRTGKSERRDLEIKKKGIFDARESPVAPLRRDTLHLILAIFFPFFFVLWIFPRSRGNFERRERKGQRERGENFVEIDRSKPLERRIGWIGWSSFCGNLGSKRKKDLEFWQFCENLIEEERRDRKRFWGERRTLNLDNSISWKFYRSSEKRILNFDNSAKICSIEKNFESWQFCDIFIDSKKF